MKFVQFIYLIHDFLQYQACIILNAGDISEKTKLGIYLHGLIFEWKGRGKQPTNGRKCKKQVINKF